jgi:hypothetical protein
MVYSRAQSRGQSSGEDAPRQRHGASLDHPMDRDVIRSEADAARDIGDAPSVRWIGPSPLAILTIENSNRLVRWLRGMALLRQAVGAAA